ncbi:MAG: hypothetical protein J6U74_03905 [Clostridia bacterium]|nr:hypothetical protein [Clostridia bacterium]
MAKRKNVQNFVPEQEVVQENVAPQEEVLFESEAYGSAQPDAGMGTTVCKPVGIGGPVPIVAPKSSTIQLQPIIVPLAVVPYMSQDCDVLKTEGVQTTDDYDEATAEFSRMEAEKEAERKKKSQKAGARAAAFFMFLLTGIVAAAYMLAYFKPEVFTLNFGKDLNVIGQIVDWAKGTAPANMALTIMHAVCFGLAGIIAITSLISLFVGKFPARFILALAILSAVAVDAAFIYQAVDAVNKGTAFVVKDYLEYIIVASVATLAFIISMIVAIAMGRKKNLYEDDFGSQDLI